MSNFTAEYVYSLEKSLHSAEYVIRRQNAEIARLTDECKALNTTIDDLRAELKYLRKATANRCGTCVYAKPVVWGRSTMHVECTNAEHLKKHCSNHESSKIRPKNTHACRNYKERSETE